MRRRKHGPKLLVIASLLGLLGLSLISLDSGKSTQTFAQQGQSCTNLAGWTPGSTPDGGSVTGYKATDATYSQTCTELSKALICNDGSFNLADANTYKYQTCTPHTRTNCTTPTNATHWIGRKTLYKSSQSTQTETCTQLSKNLQCVNGFFTGTDANLYQSATCQDQNWLPCINTWTNSYVDHLDTIQGYVSSTSTTTQSCNAFQIQLKCMNGQRSGNNGQRYTTGNQNTLSSGCTDIGVLGCQFTGGNGNIIVLMNGQSTGLYVAPTVLANQTCISGTVSCNNGVLSGFPQYRYPSCTIGGSGCTLPRGGTISDGQTEIGFSTTLRAITGQNYAGGCAPYSGTLTCNNGNLQGGTTYIYSPNECANGAPKHCYQRQGGTITNNSSMTGYSTTTAAYPHRCSDYTARLTCTNGLLNGNYQQYKYNEAQCATTGRPTDPVDLVLKVDAPINSTTQQQEVIRVAQYSSPQLTISINNIGQIALSDSFAEGFLQCDRNGVNVYKSRVITQFVANPMIPQTLSITLSSAPAQDLGGGKHITCRLNKGGEYYAGEDLTNNVRSGDLEVVTADRFDIAMERAIQPIKKNLDAPEITSALGGAETVKEFIYKKVMDVLVPLIIVIGILSAILGFYKMFFSTDDTATQEGVKYIAYGLIGIVIIMSAKFIGTTMFSMLSVTEISGSVIAQDVYNKLVYPFVKLAMYLVLGVMFVILVGRVITFLFGSSDDATKKAGTIIGRNIIAMIIIIAAKQIVEMIYGKTQDVIKPISNLGEIGSGILADKNLPILYHIINRVMGLTSLIILIIIIFQTFQLLMKPDSPEQMKSLKNSLLYVFIGLIVIGAGYLITNFLIVS